MNRVKAGAGAGVAGGNAGSPAAATAPQPPKPQQPPDFKVGQVVYHKNWDSVGVVVGVHPDEGGHFYTVKRPDGSEVQTVEDFLWEVKNGGPDFVPEDKNVGAKEAKQKEARRSDDYEKSNERKAIEEDEATGEAKEDAGINQAKEEAKEDKEAEEKQGPTQIHSNYDGFSYYDMPLYLSANEITAYWSNYNNTDNANMGIYAGIGGG